MKHGKIITTESYYDGKLAKTSKHCQESIEITDNAQLLTSVMDALDLIALSDGNEIRLTVKRNKLGQLRLIKEYEVE